jgi:hypothetical protein
MPEAGLTCGDPAEARDAAVTIAYTTDQGLTRLPVGFILGLPNEEALPHTAAG